MMQSMSFHNKTCIRSAMESVIEIAGGAPRGLGRSLLGGDLALGIGSIPLVETVKPILINIWSSSTGITGLYGRFWVPMHMNPTVTYGSGSSLETNKIRC